MLRIPGAMQFLGIDARAEVDSTTRRRSQAGNAVVDNDGEAKEVPDGEGREVGQLLNGKLARWPLDRVKPSEILAVGPALAGLDAEGTAFALRQECFA
jgi:hypothetical protein